MLTGQAPFMGSQSIEQLQSILQTNIHFQLNGVSKDSCQLIEQMLQRDQRARMSIAELDKRLNGHALERPRNKLSRVEPLNPQAVCKVRFMTFLNNTVEQLDGWGHGELVQLLVRLASDISAKREPFLDASTEAKIKAVAQSISSFENSMCKVRRKLDLEYLTFYV